MIELKHVVVGRRRIEVADDCEIEARPEHKSSTPPLLPDSNIPLATCTVIA
jgi:hypothetical protein